MPRRKSKNGNRFRKKYGKKNMGLLTNGNIVKEIKKQVAKQQQKVLEVKYQHDSNYLSLLSNYVPQTTFADGEWSGDRVDRLLAEFSPAFERGTASNKIIGDKVYLKALSMFVRYRPQQFAVFEELEYPPNDPPDDPNVPVDFETQSPYSQFPDVKIHIFRMDRDAYESHTGDAASIRDFVQKLNAVWRPTGSWKQDFVQSGGQEFIKSIKPLKTVSLKTKYRDYQIMHPKQGHLAGSAEVSSGSDYILAINDNSKPWIEKGAVGLQTQCHIQVPINEEVEIIQGSGNHNPIRFVYAMYAQFSDMYQTNVEDGWMESQIPCVFETRAMWTYTDA